jgi:hypothetical protein
MELKAYSAVILLIGIGVLYLARRDYLRGLLSERFTLLWAVSTLTGMILALVPEPFVALFRRAGVINYPSAPITLAILFLFLLMYMTSRRLGLLTQMLRRLVVTDALYQLKMQQEDRGEAVAGPRA